MSDDIILPIELFDGRLSLAEIGTIGVIMSAPHQTEDILDKWENDVMLKTNLREMEDRGILEIEDGKIIINIEQPKYKNIKIKTALNELYEKEICNEDNVDIIRDILEELANEFYHMGYEDGRVDFEVGDDTFTAYGKKEDFS